MKTTFRGVGDRAGPRPQRNTWPSKVPKGNLSDIVKLQADTRVVDQCIVSVRLLCLKGATWENHTSRIFDRMFGIEQSTPCR